MKFERITERLVESGWTLLTGYSKIDSDLSSNLTQLAEHLGKPIESRKGRDVVEIIKPLSKEEALPKSLSFKFGTGFFPMHSETAHWPIPCKYMMLCCINEGQGGRRTLLIDFRRIKFSKNELEVLRSGIFLMRNAKNSFYSNIIASHNDFIRFDPGCMEPMNLAAKRALEIMDNKFSNSSPVEIKWNTGDLLLLNNWHMLHGRSESNRLDSDRELLRILIMRKSDQKQ
jgi:hypothetical protein